MNNINLILEVQKQIQGLGQEVVAISIGVLIDNSIIIKPDSEIIVNVNINFSTMEGTINIAQQLSTSNIVIVEGNKILMLNGLLYIVGTPTTIVVIDSNVDIYYISNN